MYSGAKMCLEVKRSTINIYEWLEENEAKAKQLKVRKPQTLPPGEKVGCAG